MAFLFRWRPSIWATAKFMKILKFASGRRVWERRTKKCLLPRSAFPKLSFFSWSLIFLFARKSQNEKRGRKTFIPKVEIVVSKNYTSIRGSRKLICGDLEKDVWDLPREICNSTVPLFRDFSNFFTLLFCFSGTETIWFLTIWVKRWRSEYSRACEKFLDMKGRKKYHSIISLLFWARHNSQFKHWFLTKHFILLNFYLENAKSFKVVFLRPSRKLKGIVSSPFAPLWALGFEKKLQPFSQFCDFFSRRVIKLCHFVRERSLKV